MSEMWFFAFLHSNAKQPVQGYYFVFTEYHGGRVVLGAHRFKDEKGATRAAERRREKLASNPNFKRVRVGYQPSLSDVDIKKFI